MVTTRGTGMAASVARRWGAPLLGRRLMALLVLAGVAFAALVFAAPPAMAATGAATTCTQASSGTTTCTATDGSGAVTGTCTLTGAPYCTPSAAAGGAGDSGTVNNNLNTLKNELTPNIGAIFSNPVTAPLMKLGLFVLDCIAIYLLGSALIGLMFKVHEQSKVEGRGHLAQGLAWFAVRGGGAAPDRGGGWDLAADGRGAGHPVLDARMK